MRITWIVLVSVLFAHGAQASQSLASCRPVERSLTGTIASQLRGVEPAGYLEAIARLNEYRRGMGLQELTIDPELSGAAQKHADYYAHHCRNRSAFPYNGHFETPGTALYSAEGDEAAKESGLGLAAHSPLHALEMLLSIPYHRTQFLSPGLSRVGIGFTDARAPSGLNCSIGLFFTKPPLPGGPSVHVTRGMIVPFPPEGMTVPEIFNPSGENPDPRPAAERRGRMTGYPITIRMLHHEDAAQVREVRATLTDERGARQELWISHPSAPAIRGGQAPQDIYDNGTQELAAGWFERNHESIFLLPKQPLAGGMRHSVDVEIINRDGTTRRVSWTFRTSNGSVLDLLR